MKLPQLLCSDGIIQTNNNDRLFIAAEGFEKRSVFWIKKQIVQMEFKNAIICKYLPRRKSLMEDIMYEVTLRCENSPILMEYSTIEPTLFEQSLHQNRIFIFSHPEIVIDISVMSKLLIMILLFFLRSYQGRLVLVYSEPLSWGPTEEEYNQVCLNRMEGSYIALSSVGVLDVIRTPSLSSIIMQSSPILLVSFLSFNEQLVTSLLNSVNPYESIFINTKYERFDWKEQALCDMHKSVIGEYLSCNPFLNGKMCRTFSNSDYVSVFNELADIYKNNCFSKRIVISPTGTKLQSVACSLIKICCPDIHVEYPIPESYLFNSYSSDEVFKSHVICFENFADQMRVISNDYELDG